MRPFLCLSTALLFFGCSAGKHAGGSGGGGGVAGAGSTTGATGTGTSSSAGGSSSAGTMNGGGGEGGLGGFGGQGGGMPPQETEVFGQSASALYKLDPLTKEVTTVGMFDGCSGVIDIALDKDGGMVGTTTDGLYKIDKTTAKCTFIASGDYPNSLSFVPAGTLDANDEALVGYEGSNYVRVDPKTGTKTMVKEFALGDYSSSGDIVSVINGGTYLTVTGGPELCADCILQVDPKTGAVIKNIGALGHSNVYGLAFWGGVAYGFDSYGELFQIDLSNGKSTILAQPNAPNDLSYYGAGSSTNVPIEPPK